LRLTRHDCMRTVDTSLLKMFQKKNLKRKLKDLVLEFIDEKI
jgi:DNA-binding TFAR19-related protein (PDSD5 family)